MSNGQWAWFNLGIISRHSRISTNISEFFQSTHQSKRFHFLTDKGKIIDEYQWLYISNGEGCYISENSKKPLINEGDIFRLLPEEWHNFKPDYQTGWEFYWIKFNRFTINTLVRKEIINKQKSVFLVGINNEI